MYDSTISTAEILSGNGYKIGAVSRITGIPVDRLRIWERRYSVVEPARTPAQGRIYNEQQVDKLRLIKKLIDKGDRIGSIANLTLEQLEYRLRVFTEPSNEMAKPQSKIYQISALGKSLKLYFQTHVSSDEIYQVNSVHSKQSEFEDHIVLTKPDILLIECAGLVESKIRNFESLMNASKAKKLIIIYSFASERLLRYQKDENWVFLKAPLTASKLNQALKTCCYSLEPHSEAQSASLPESVADNPQERIFTEQQLFKISKEAPVIKCECPQHLAFIIKKLYDFEEYSESCSIDSIQDKELHKALFQHTAKARTLMEKALKHLLDVEGVEYLSTDS